MVGAAGKGNPRPSKRVMRNLPSRYTLFETGELTIDDLDDEEIMRGRLRNQNGDFRGHPPALVGRVFVEAIAAAQRRRISELLRAELPTAVKALHEVAEWGGGKGGMARAAAAKTLLEYAIGRPVESVDLRVASAGETEKAPWEGLVMRAFYPVEPPKEIEP